MLLAQSDAAVLAAWSAVIVAMISGVVTIGVRIIGARLGDPNGHGSISQAMTTVIARLDGQDRASAEERRLRDDGMQRQLRILDEIAEVKAAQESYVRAGDLGSVDLIQRLELAVTRITTLLGEPEDGWDDTPVIPYVHRCVHELRNEIGKLRTANSLLAQHVTREGET